MIDWPEPLIDSLARRRCVVFIGSGVSRQSLAADGVTAPPGWISFLEAACLECGNPRHVRRAIKHGDLLTACEWVRTRIDDGWTGFLRKNFVTPRFRPADIHKLIYKLDSSIVATPNFDKIFDGLATAESEGTTLIKSYDDEDLTQVVRGGHRVVLKIHGTIDSPDRMIFTKSDYARTRVEYSGFYEIVSALLVTHTFLLLGCGINDPDVQLLFENYRYGHPRSPPHYMTFPTPLHGDQEEIVRETRNIRALRYSPASNHLALTTALSSLLEKVEARRGELAGSLSW
jgi:hypothetical protein